MKRPRRHCRGLLLPVPGVSPAYAGDHAGGAMWIDHLDLWTGQTTPEEEPDISGFLLCEVLCVPPAVPDRVPVVLGPAPPDQVVSPVVRRRSIRMVSDYFTFCWWPFEGPED